MFNKILIIGCGLIGSSILRASLSKKITKKIFVYEISKKNISKIKKISSKIIILKKLDQNISDINLVILCTPMSQYKKIIPKLNNFLTHDSIITDVGSTKSNVDLLIKKKLKKSLDWIMSHPIAGSEVSGPEYGDKNLFKNKWCVIIKDKNSIKFKKITNFWKKLGANIAVMDKNEHDKIFSITSHLPHLIAYNLVKSAQDFERIQKYDLIKYSAGGLRDFSRIAASNEIMWRDIFFNNKKNISKAIDLFIKNLNSFKKDINSKNNKSILTKLINTKKVRTKIIKLKQDINKPDFGRN